MLGVLKVVGNTQSRLVYEQLDVISSPTLAEGRRARTLNAPKVTTAYQHAPQQKLQILSLVKTRPGHFLESSTAVFAQRVGSHWVPPEELNVWPGCSDRHDRKSGAFILSVQMLAVSLPSCQDRVRCMLLCGKLAAIISVECSG